MDSESKLAFYEKIFQSINGTVYILDINEGKIHWITDNYRVHESLGLSAAEIVAAGAEYPKRLLPYPDYGESMTDAIAYFKANPDTKWIGLYRIRGKDDALKWALYSTAAFDFDENGELCKTITMSMDVTKEIHTNKVLADYIKTSLRKQYAHIYDNLTDREIEVIRKIITGISTRKIAEELFLSHHTIESHKSKIFKKLSVKSSVELAQLAEKVGMTM